MNQHQRKLIPKVSTTVLNVEYGKKEVVMVGPMFGNATTSLGNTRESIKILKKLSPNYDNILRH